MPEKSLQRVNLRKSHPGLYRLIRIIGIGCLAWGANFWGLGFIPPPTFNPYGVDKNIVGTVFSIIGIALLVFLIFVHNLWWLRVSVFIALVWLISWGITNTQQFLDGKASLQLPIAYVIIGFLCRPMLTESPVNPFTEEQ